MNSNPFRTDGAATLQALGFEITLERRRVADLFVGSGRIVICDPFDSPETEPFDFEVPAGRYPISLLFAELRDEMVLAYVAVEFSDEPSRAWELAPIHGDEARRWNDPEHAGFHVESGLMAILDEELASTLLDLGLTEEGEEDFQKLVRRELGKGRRGNNFRSGWASVEVDPGSEMFVLEVDKGTYRTHLSRDADGNPALIVVDLRVLDIQFTPYGLRF